MRGWIKVPLCVLALTVGAGAPTLIVETIRPGSIPPLNPPSQSESTPKDKISSSQTKTLEEPPADWVARFTGGLVIVGILQLIAFGLQAFWLRRTVKSSEKSDEILERAYLWPGLGLGIDRDVPGKLKYPISVHNTGRTVGVLKSVYAEICRETEFKTTNRIPL
jgi:hypothetical protein